LRERTGIDDRPAQIRGPARRRQCSADEALLHDRRGSSPHQSDLALLAAFVGFDAPPVDATERTTAKQAAYDLGCSQSRVRQWIDDGSLKAIKVGGRLLIDAASVAKLVRERNPGRA
jgi:excisionase family DNA binding protein